MDSGPGKEKLTRLFHEPPIQGVVRDTETIEQPANRLPLKFPPIPPCFPETANRCRPVVIRAGAHFEVDGIVVVQVEFVELSFEPFQITAADEDFFLLPGGVSRQGFGKVPPLSLPEGITSTTSVRDLAGWLGPVQHRVIPGERRREIHRNRPFSDRTVRKWTQSHNFPLRHVVPPMHPIFLHPGMQRRSRQSQQPGSMRLVALRPPQCLDNKKSFNLL